ncbi:flavin-containing monooxygenase FMO GS-OX-like 4 [Panicum miliaceum]|uniref:Flavin-containing monooxygenase n=1 Tax=Panicum miliaceum TaxID=4540 RepID=A0A3L6S059_PANMI|nr:flavin-containing monooxygenase FMO GS-OX-like 4 [Panicum miliaceum]
MGYDGPVEKDVRSCQPSPLKKTKPRIHSDPTCPLDLPRESIVTEDSTPTTMRSLRVAVIGAGAAGLAAARELRREGHAPVVFERAGDVGGTWIYDDQPKPINWAMEMEGGGHSSLYASLRTNLPREVMGFLDFPFAAGPESVDPRRFPRHQEVLRYLQEFARRFHLYGLIRFRTEVTHVVVQGGGGGCKVRVSWRRNAAAAAATEQEEEEYDAVVVCNGHYTEPRIADIPGSESWPGKQMHSHSYRVPDPFRDQVVVIVGAKNSGGDISRDIAGVAKEVHMANRASPAATCERLQGYHNLWLHSMVERAEADGSVVFRDGTSVRAHVILHCTGYKYSFPFLGDGVVSVDDNRIHPLYKHVFVPQLAPHLAFIGLPFKVVPFPLAQLQASWVAGALSGRIQLPSEEEMMEDVRALYSEVEALGWPVRYTHCLKHNQFEYDDWLAEQCGLAGVEDWRKQMYDAACKKKVECPERYREEWDDHHLLEQANHHFQNYSYHHI